MAGGTTSARDGVQKASQGRGPLLERDYWAVIEEPVAGAAELMDALARRFPGFAPPRMVSFIRPESDEGPLDVGHEMDVVIAGAATCGVRVVHRDRQSLTVATLPGHPEAGRITFGVYPDADGDLVFHIRSRARSSSNGKLLGFLFAGDPMQTNTWTDFIARFAGTMGAGVRGGIHAEKRKVEPEPGDEAVDRPTFLARGG